MRSDPLTRRLRRATEQLVERVEAADGILPLTPHEIEELRQEAHFGPSPRRALLLGRRRVLRAICRYPTLRGEMVRALAVTEDGSDLPETFELVDVTAEPRAEMDLLRVLRDLDGLPAPSVTAPDR